MSDEERPQEASEHPLDRFLPQIEARIRELLSPEQYAVFLAFSERRQRMPEAAANMQEMLVLRVLTEDPEFRRLQQELHATLRARQ